MPIPEQHINQINEDIRSNMIDAGLYVISAQNRVRWYEPNRFPVAQTVSPVQTSGDYSALDVLVDSVVRGITHYYDVSGFPTSAFLLTPQDPISADSRYIGLKYDPFNLKVDSSGRLTTIQNINPSSSFSIANLSAINSYNNSLSANKFYLSGAFSGLLSATRNGVVSVNVDLTPMVDYDPINLRINENGQLTTIQDIHSDSDFVTNSLTTNEIDATSIYTTTFVGSQVSAYNLTSTLISASQGIFGGLSAMSLNLLNYTSGVLSATPNGVVAVQISNGVVVSASDLTDAVIKTPLTDGRNKIESTNDVILLPLKRSSSQVNTVLNVKTSADTIVFEISASGDVRLNKRIDTIDGLYVRAGSTLPLVLDTNSGDVIVKTLSATRATVNSSGVFLDAYAASSKLYGRRDNSVSGVNKQVVTQGDVLFDVRSQAYDGTQYRNASQIYFFVDGPVTSGTYPPTGIIMATNPSGSAPVNRVFVTSGGSVLIGNLSNFGDNFNGAQNPLVLITSESQSDGLRLDSNVLAVSGSGVGDSNQLRWSFRDASGNHKQAGAIRSVKSDDYTTSQKQDARLEFFAASSGNLAKILLLDHNLRAAIGALEDTTVSADSSLHVFLNAVDSEALFAAKSNTSLPAIIKLRKEREGANVQNGDVVGSIRSTGRSGSFQDLSKIDFTVSGGFDSGALPGSMISFYVTNVSATQRKIFELAPNGGIYAPLLSGADDRHAVITSAGLITRSNRALLDTGLTPNRTLRTDVSGFMSVNTETGSGDHVRQNSPLLSGTVSASNLNVYQNLFVSGASILSAGIRTKDNVYIGQDLDVSRNLSVSGLATVTSFPTGRVVITSAGGNLNVDNLYWDNTNDRLGVGSGAASPSSDFIISKPSAGQVVRSTLINSSNYANSSSLFEVLVTSATAGNPRINIGIEALSIWGIGVKNDRGDRFAITSDGDLNSTYIEIDGPAGAVTMPNGHLIVSGGLAALIGETVITEIKNVDGQFTNSHAKLQIGTTTSAGGDPFIHFKISDTEEFSIGVDNSDGDSFVISDYLELGTNNRFKIDSNGLIYFPIYNVANRVLYFSSTTGLISTNPGFVFNGTTFIVSGSISAANYIGGGSVSTGAVSASSVNVSNLTASRLVATDAGKNLSSNGALVSNGAVFGTGTGSLSATSALTNGQLLIGSTGNTPAPANISGTINQITVSNGAGSITLSTPQNINVSANPTFNNLSLTGNALVSGNLSASGVVKITNLSPSLPVFTNAVDELISAPMTGSGGVVMSASPIISSPNFIATTTINGPAIFNSTINLSAAPLSAYTPYTLTPAIYIGQTVAASDYWRIYGEGLSNAGKLVFEMGDDGSETFIWRHRYPSTTTDTMSLIGGTGLVISVGGASSNALQLTSTATGNGMTIGGDTNLYRSAVNTLKTDGSLLVTGELQVSDRAMFFGTSTITGVNSNRGAAFFGASSGLQIQIDGDEIQAMNNSTASVLYLNDRGGNVIIGRGAGALTLIGPNETYFNSNEIDSGYSINANAALYLNWRGYNNGYTQFRDLFIGDGKGANIVQFEGSTKDIEFYGQPQAQGGNAITGANANRGSAWFGTQSGLQIQIDADDIQAMNNNSVSNLYINYAGGAVVFAGAGGVYIKTDELDVGYNTNANDQLYINYSGYQGGLTQFRDLIIADGKGATIASMQGSTKDTDFFGLCGFRGGSAITGANANRGSAWFGTQSGLQIQIDGDEIQAMNNNTPVTLSLNTRGTGGCDIAIVTAAVTKIGGQQTYFINDEINGGYNNNANAGLYINYRGYNNDFTQFRDLVIGDGKGETIATFDGSSRNFKVEGSDGYVTTDCNNNARIDLNYNLTDPCAAFLRANAGKFNVVADRAITFAAESSFTARFDAGAVYIGSTETDPSSTLQIGGSLAGKYLGMSSNSSAQGYVFINFTASSTYYLPDASESPGRAYFFLRSYAGVGTSYVNRDFSDTITVGGSTGITSQPFNDVNKFALFVSDGLSTWYAFYHNL